MVKGYTTTGTYNTMRSRQKPTDAVARGLASNEAWRKSHPDVGVPSQSFTDGYVPKSTETMRGRARPLAEDTDE